MSGPDDLRDFDCPICGSDNALCVVVIRPDGSTYKTDFYSCAGCTVMFRDIKRFKFAMRSTYDRNLKQWREKPTRGDT
jgi:hypothetical protein